MKKPPLQEIASSRDGNDITAPFLARNRTAPVQDPLLREKAAGDPGFYEFVLSDDQVKATLAQRIGAVVAAEWDVLPGGETRKEKEAAEKLKQNLIRIDWNRAVEKMLYGIFFGYSVAEIMWEAPKGFVDLQSITTRNPRRFRFDTNSKLLLKTVSQPDGKPMPDNKFWVFSAGSWHDDDPYGRGLAHFLYWPVTFRRATQKEWCLFLEKYALPTVRATYPPGTREEDQEKLLEACQAVRRDTGIVLPEGMVIDLMEATRNGSADFSTMYDRMNFAISKIILGATLTSEQGGSYAHAKVHDSAKNILVKSDAEKIDASFNCGPVLWWTRWNYGDIKPPKVWRNTSPAPDLYESAQTTTLIANMGFKPDLAWINSHFNGNWSIDERMTKNKAANKSGDLTPQETAAQKRREEPLEKTFPRKKQRRDNDSTRAFKTPAQTQGNRQKTTPSNDSE